MLKLMNVQNDASGMPTSWASYKVLGGELVLHDSLGTEVIDLFSSQLIRTE